MHFLAVFWLLASTAWASPSAEKLAAEIDQEIERVRESKGLPVAASAKLPEFTRRAYFDFLGRPPTHQESSVFSALPNGKAHQAICSTVTQGAEFDAYWAMVWRTWLEKPDRGEEFVRDLEYEFDYARSLKEVSYRLKVFLRNILHSGKAALLAVYRGDLIEDPDGEEIRRNERFFEFAPLIDKVGRTFLGTRVGCVRCHDDYLRQELETSDYEGIRSALKYWQYNQRFSRGVHGLGLAPESELPAELRELPDPGPHRLLPTDAHDRTVHGFISRVVENPRLSHALVHRFWNHLFGRSLSWPRVYDDLPLEVPSHPEYGALIARVSERFSQLDFRQDVLLEALCLTSAYGRSGQEDIGFDDYSSMPLKPKTEEQLVAHILAAHRTEDIEYREILKQADFLFLVVSGWTYKVGEDRLEDPRTFNSRVDRMFGEEWQRLYVDPTTRSIAGENPKWNADAVKKAFWAVLGRDANSGEIAKLLKVIRPPSIATQPEILLEIALEMARVLPQPPAEMELQVRLNHLLIDIFPLAHTRRVPYYARLPDEETRAAGVRKRFKNETVRDLERAAEIAFQQAYPRYWYDWKDRKNTLLKYARRFQWKLSPDGHAIQDLVWALSNSSEFLTVP